MGPFWIIALWALLSQSAQAGTDIDVTVGIVAYNQQDYAKAKTRLEQALAPPVALKAKNVPKAKLYLAKTKHAWVLLTLNGGAASPDLASEHAELVAAVTLMNEVKERGDSLASEAERELPKVQQTVIQIALMSLNEAHQTKDQAGYERAERWASLGVQAGPALYMAYDFRGQARERLGQSAEGHADFVKALDLYEAAPPSKPDLFIPYVAYRAALLLVGQEGHDPEDVFALIERGLALVGAAEAQAASLTEADRQLVSAARQDLTRLRLDRLIKDPSRRDAAVTALEKELEGAPNDYLLLVALAQMFETSDLARAQALYERAIAADPSQVLAHFNLGSLWYNAAAAKAKEESATEDIAAADRLAAEKLDLMRKALPHFERAHAIQPEDPALLGALITLSLTLGDHEAYQRYKAQKEALP